MQPHIIDILTLFPDYFKGPFDESIVRRARDRGLINLRLHDIRAFADDRHKTVDDRPYGGGPGMVMKAEPVAKAIRSVKTEESYTVYLSPQGETLNAEIAKELAAKRHLIFLSGHYEGIDQRVLDREVDREISIGDYVLTSGSAAAIVAVDALIRFIPGVLGHERAAFEDSFEEGMFDCPHYTRPEEFEGETVPEVLLSGNHKQIAEWRRREALRKTMRVRPDLLHEGVER